MKESIKGSSGDPKERVPHFKSDHPQDTTDTWTGNKKAMYVDDKYLQILKEEGSLAAGRYRKKQALEGKSKTLTGAAAGGHRIRRSKFIQEIRDGRRKTGEDTDGTPKPTEDIKNIEKSIKALEKAIQDLRDETTKQIELLQAQIENLHRQIHDGEDSNNVDTEEDEIDENDSDTEEEEVDKKDSEEEDINTTEEEEESDNVENNSILDAFANNTAAYASEKFNIKKESIEKAREYLEGMPRWKRMALYLTIGAITAGGVAAAGLIGGAISGLGLFGILAGHVAGGVIGGKMGRKFVESGLGKKIGFGKGSLNRVKASAGYDKAMNTFRKDTKTAERRNIRDRKKGKNIVSTVEISEEKMRDLVDTGAKRTVWAQALMTTLVTGGAGVAIHYGGDLWSMVANDPSYGSTAPTLAATAPVQPPMSAVGGEGVSFAPGVDASHGADIVAAHHVDAFQGAQPVTPEASSVSGIEHTSSALHPGATTGSYNGELDGLNNANSFGGSANIDGGGEMIGLNGTEMANGSHLASSVPGSESLGSIPTPSLDSLVIDHASNLSDGIEKTMQSFGIVPDASSIGHTPGGESINLLTDLVRDMQREVAGNTIQAQNVLQHANLDFLKDSGVIDVMKTHLLNTSGISQNIVQATTQQLDALHQAALGVGSIDITIG